MKMRLTASIFLSFVGLVSPAPSTKPLLKLWQTLDEAIAKKEQYLSKPHPKTGDVFLHSAIREQERDDIIALIRAGIGLNVANYRKETPLILAAKMGDRETVLYLLQHEVKLDACDCDGYSALHMAAIRGSAPIAELLLAKGAEAKVGEGVLLPVHVAAISGSLDVMAVLRKYGANLNAIGTPGCSMGNTPLVWSVINKHAHLAKWLLDAGVDTDFRSTNTTSEYARMSALMVAVYTFQENMVELLLKAGAGPNLSNINWRTALHFMVRGPLPDPFEQSESRKERRRKRPPNTSRDETKLKGMLNLLDAHGVNPCQQDGNGWTVLHLAVMTKDAASVNAIFDKISRDAMAGVLSGWIRLPGIKCAGTLEETVWTMAVRLRRMEIFATMITSTNEQKITSEEATKFLKWLNATAYKKSMAKLRNRILPFPDFFAIFMDKYAKGRGDAESTFRAYKKCKAYAVYVASKIIYPTYTADISAKNYEYCGLRKEHFEGEERKRVEIFEKDAMVDDMRKMGEELTVEFGYISRLKEDSFLWTMVKRDWGDGLEFREAVKRYYAADENP